MYVDVHAHLDDKAFDADLDEVIKNAQNVSVIINNAIDEASLQKCQIISQKYPQCKVAAGLYPDTIVQMSEEDIEVFLTKLKTINCIAIGEIGLDYKWTKEKSDREKQITYFQKQLDIAKKRNIPVILHTRSAEKEVIEILQANKQKKVLLHCFCGKLSLVKHAVSLGYSFSIPPKIISDPQFERMVEIIPLSQLLTETDSPYLHYEKGKRNEPKFVAKTVGKIAQIKKISEHEATNIIFLNYQRLFL